MNSTKIPAYTGMTENLLFLVPFLGFAKISGCLNGASAARRHGCQQAQRDCQPTSPRHQQTATTLLLAHTFNLPIFRLPFTHAITPSQKAA